MNVVLNIVGGALLVAGSFLVLRAVRRSMQEREGETVSRGTLDRINGIGANGTTGSSRETNRDRT